MANGWYPHYGSYYVSDPDPEYWPVRQGDIVAAPKHLGSESDDPWLACQIVHPSCEIGAKTNPEKLQVIRVSLIAGVFSTESDQTAVLQKFKLKDGDPQIAFANTFFLPPPLADLAEPVYSDFRQIRTVPRGSLSSDARWAALTHDARVYFIRRKLYWEQRWVIELSEVRRIEAKRIRQDSEFVGTKPEWAVSAHD